MKKFTKGLAALAVFGILTFGFGFDKVAAEENSAANISEDLNLTKTDVKIIFAPPPGFRHDPPPPHHRYDPPPPGFRHGSPPPPPHRRDPHHRHRW